MGIELTHVPSPVVQTPSPAPSILNSLIVKKDYSQ